MNFKTKINRIRMIIFFILCALTIDIILPISVSASESQPIMGEAIANREEMIEYYRENAPTSYPQEYLAQDIELDKLVEVIIHEAETEGVRADVAFVQILLETNWLKFDRGINIRQNNFGGLKDQDENYLSFDSIDEGIRANIQLLKGYASSEPLNQQKVTSLYGLISPKGNIVNVDSLGNGNWSQDSEYGENIKQYLDEIINIKSIHNQENESEPPQPKLEDQTEAIDIKKETIQDAAGKTIEPKTENDLLHQEELRTSKANLTAKLEEFTIDGSGHVGGSHKLEALGSSPNGVEYQFWIKDLSTNKWTMIQDYGTKATATWTPIKSGNYWYGVHIRDSSKNVYRDAHLYKNITIKGVTAKLEEFAIDGPGHVGGSHKLEALGSSPNGVEYQFWIKDLSTNKWRMIQDYGAKDTATWTPKKSGNYWYGVHIRDKYNNVYRDAHLYKNITIKGVTAKLEGFAIDGPGHVGGSHKLEALGSSPNGVEYQFWIKDLSTDKWTMIQDYGTKDIATWTPKKSGNYWYGVHIRDKYNNVYRDVHLYKNITIKGVTAKLEGFAIDGPGHVGGSHKLEALGSSPNGVEYQFWIKDLSTNKWTMIQDYGTKDTATWTPKKSGNYWYGVHIRDSSKNVYRDAHLYKNITIEGVAAKLEDFTIEGPKKTGEPHILQALGNSPNGVEYQFWIKDLSTNKWTMIQDYGTKDTATWTPKKSGNYWYGVHIRDKYNNVYRDAHLYKNITIEQSIVYSYYSQIFKDVLQKQMNVNPQTDYYGGGWKNADVDDVRYFLNPNNFINDKVDAIKINTISGSLNVRDLPTTSGSKVITKVNKNEIYPILDQSNGWYKVIANNRIGWVSGEYVLFIQVKSDQKYQFLDLSKPSGIRETDLNNYLKGKGSLEGYGNAFKKACNNHKINESYLVSHALLETGNGTSDLATGILVDLEGRMVDKDRRLIDTKGNFIDTKGDRITGNQDPVTGKGPYTIVYNVLGIGALDVDPKRLGAKRAFDEGWTTIDKAIVGGAKFVSEKYINHPIYQQNTLYKMRWNPGNPATHQYATDMAWAYKQIFRIKELYDLSSNYTLYFDIPNYK